MLAAVVALCASAVVATGFRRPQPDLHDAGVWVTWAGQQALGRTNTEIRQIDVRLAASSSDFDVLQSGATVLLHQASTNHLRTVNPRLATLEADAQLPAGAQVALGGEEPTKGVTNGAGVTTAVLDSGRGRLWIAGAAEATGSSYGDDAKPTATVDGGQLLAVGGDGSVHVLAPARGTVTSFAPGGATTATREVPNDLDVGALQLAAVGDRPVLLDRRQRRLLVAGGPSTDLSDLGDGLVLQESSGEGGAAIVAGAKALAKVPLGGGAPQVVADNGTGAPARPVSIRGCAFGAWAGAPSYAVACDGDDLDSGPLPGIRPNGSLRFRVNRDRVVVNEPSTGESVLVGDGTPQPLDWSQALSDRADAEAKPNEEAKTQTDDKRLEREQNDPPVARPDVAGTRRGRPVVVPVLRNDGDPDGDVLVVSSLGRLADERGRAAVVAGGEAVQVTPNANLDRGSMSFSYTIDDGHEHTASADVAVTVYPPEVNNPPVVGQQRTIVSAGSSVTHDVLDEVTDPEGDATKLVTASVPAGKGTVQFEPGGKITYTAPPEQRGEVLVSFTVADQLELRAEGVLKVDVRDPATNLHPTARNDHAVTYPAREVVVRVLENDSDPDGDTLSIVRVPGHPTATFTWAPPSQEVRVRAERPGAYDIVYEITDGEAVTSAVLRVDVLEQGLQQPPVAVRDDVVLRPGETVVADVLANDIDVNGDVLLITSLQVPTPSPVTVEVIERRYLRIGAPAPLTRPYELRYVVTDGSGTDTGTVVVQPGALPPLNQPPVAVPDEITLRAGNAVTLPVLANDRDPDGDTIVVDGFEPLKPGDGAMFVQSGELRYLAPAIERGSVSTTYRVRDGFGNVASGALVLHVTPPGPERNNPPAAPDLTARVLAGGKVMIPVPVGSLDPDGDPVTLLGIGDKPPQKGSVIEVLPDRLHYQADRRVQGTDELSYRVRDSFGAESSGRVLVGIAPAATANTPPAAVFDRAEVRPGEDVDIAVLRNDNDLDGDVLHLSGADGDQPTVRIGAVARAGDSVRYTAPADAAPGTKVSFTYVVVDGNGGRANGIVEVTVTLEVTNRPPIPRDDTADPQQPQQEVVVAVLENDVDPDGPKEGLRVAEVLDLPGATVVDDGRKVRFVMPAGPVTFRYVVTDGRTGGTAQAVVRVPMAADRAPVTRLDEVTTESGQPVTVDVLANDEDPDGADLRLVRAVGPRNGDARVDGGKVTFTPAPGYVGDAGFSYVVADGPDDAKPQLATGTARVLVSGRNTKPTCAARPVEVSQGSDAGTLLDLKGSVDDLNPDDIGKHRFESLEGESGGVTGRLEEDGRLNLKAATAAARGTLVTLTYTVVDPGDAGKVPDCQVLVTVVASDKPLAQAVADATRTIQGKAVEVDVTANDVNPFPATPLRVVEARATSGGEAVVAGGAVRFTPAPDFFGSATISYRVEDETLDVGRHATGNLTVIVVGRPAAPPAPAAKGVESRTVHLTWGIPPNNGAPISEYLVRSDTGAEVKATTNAVSFGGLTNNKDVRFTVIARNEAGDSPPSPASPAYRPDQVPAVAVAPTAKWGNTSIDVTWVAPAVEGSPITEYTLRVSPPPPSGPASRPVQGLTHTWTGLENGVAYSFAVRAKNSAGEASGFSPESNRETPAGPPLQPAAPTTTKGDLKITVVWTEPRTNGDPIAAYELQVFKEGTLERTSEIADGTTRTQEVVTENGRSYTFALRARNKAGFGPLSNRSATTVSSGTPRAVAAVSASEGDSASQLTFDAPDANGSTITGYQYSTGSAWSALAPDRIVRGLTNGSTYQFQVRAVNANGPSTTPSGASNPITPYGPPGPPTVSGSRADALTLRWTWNANALNGRQLAGYQFKIDGGGYGQTTMSTAHFQTFGYSEDHTLCVVVITNGADPARSRSGQVCSTVRTADRPPVVRNIRIYATGETTPCDSNPSSTCNYIASEISGFPANTDVELTCYSNQFPGGYQPHLVRTNGAGAGTKRWCAIAPSNTDFWIRARAYDVESNHINP